MNDIVNSQCFRIEALLKKGESWTRQAWINHPELKGKKPRIIILREFDTYRNRETNGEWVSEHKDHFKQIWNGDVDEPQLCMIYYRPSDEDYVATDWLQVDRNGDLTGYVLPDIKESQ